MSSPKDGGCLTGGLVKAIDEGSPAWAAGIEPGDRIISADGSPLRDVLDWRWLSSGTEVAVEVVDGDGTVHHAELEREFDEDWGISFTDALFDGVRRCRNDCTFCFMKQLPAGVRRPLVTRDDDFRLSFLEGNFITLTNMDDDDIERVVEQRLSPLRVSVHAVDPEIRTTLIGRNHARGLENLERLLDSGIGIDAQIVLVPGVNDGGALEETLGWLSSHPGVRNVAVVPLGYTRHQESFTHGYEDPADALTVLDTISRFQERAMAERGEPWVIAADELYAVAYGEQLLDELPDAAFYGAFEMFDDGIGIIRSMVDELADALDGVDMPEGRGSSTKDPEDILGDRDPSALEDGGSRGALGNAPVRCAYVCGMAMMPYFGIALASHGADSWLEPLPVENEWLGGNVTVTGLLSGGDIANAIADHAASNEGYAYAIPDIVLNDDDVTLDDHDIGWIARKASEISGDEGLEDRVFACASNPIDYIPRIIGRLHGGSHPRKGAVEGS